MLIAQCWEEKHGPISLVLVSRGSTSIRGGPGRQSMNRTSTVGQLLKGSNTSQRNIQVSGNREASFYHESTQNIILQMHILPRDFGRIWTPNYWPVISWGYLWKLCARYGLERSRLLKYPAVRHWLFASSYLKTSLIFPRLFTQIKLRRSYDEAKPDTSLESWRVQRIEK